MIAVKMKRYGLYKIGFLLMFITICILVLQLSSHAVEDPHRLISRSQIKDEVTQEILQTNKIPLDEPCKISLVQNDTQFLNYFKTLEGLCTNWQHYGVGDGLKYICMDAIFNIKPGNCNVLSFGINNEWSFDDKMDEFGCKVYAFDPTMGKEDHNRSQNIQFFKLGIGSIDGKQKVGMDNKWTMEKVNRYETILTKIGLTNTPIDYIKMDVEYAELDFFMDVFINSPQLLKNIKQIGMEVHHGYKDGILGHSSLFQKFWVCFQLMKCHGFKLIYVRNNGPWDEVVWARFDNW